MASINHQQVTTWRFGNVDTLELPAPHVEILPGVRWGRFEDFFTPAFWVSRVWIDGKNSELSQYKIGRTLREEVAACLLGGHGMPAEVGLAAFERLRNKGLLSGLHAVSEVENALTEPLRVRGRIVRYRFPRAKAAFLAAAMYRLNTEMPPVGSGRDLRNWLLNFRGIGPKTASWIARNTVGTDDVAILDIHIVRAGLLMGLFSQRQSVAKDYFDMEARLVAFARAAGVSLSRFDSVIWCYMRHMHEMVMNALTTVQTV